MTLNDASLTPDEQNRLLSNFSHDDSETGIVLRIRIIDSFPTHWNMAESECTSDRWPFAVPPLGKSAQFHVLRMYVGEFVVCSSSVVTGSELSVLYHWNAV